MSAEAVKELTSKEKAEKQNRAVCLAIFATRDDLGITDTELAKIFGVSKKTLGRWEVAGEIPNLELHLREATSHFIAIFRSLSAMFSNSKDRSAWIKTFHPELGQAPLEMISSSMEGLIRVRRYLDYVRDRGA